VSTGRISLLISKELQTLVLAMRELDKEVTKQIRAQTRTTVEPVWKEAVRSRVTTRLQTRVLSDTARAAVSDMNVTLRSANTGKLSSGAPTSSVWTGVELGGNTRVATVTSPKGKSYQRHVTRQFPAARRKGYVVFPAAREVIPRIASLWVATVVRTTHEIFEKGGVK